MRDYNCSVLIFICVLATHQVREASTRERDCNIPGLAQNETQVLQVKEGETLDMTPLTSYKRGSPLRVQPQERQQAKPCPSRTPPPPLATVVPPPSKPAAAHRPRSPSRRTRAPSRRLLDSVSCKQLRSEPQGGCGYVEGKMLQSKAAAVTTTEWESFGNSVGKLEPSSYSFAFDEFCYLGQHEEADIVIWRLVAK
ncbi:unnamed protein product [Brassica oleracea var. botrytis]|uniref:(rape) hypothetical protein n=1 Tax=Brassica napus TaxID=3708 RepID=A0A816QGG3_BRANA|nr:unnamed protein product [Brassica napus]